MRNQDATARDHRPDIGWVPAAVGVGIDRAGQLHARQAFDAVLELPHVARPVVGEQPLHRAGREHRARQLVGLGVAFAKGFQQELDVVAALTQGRHLHGNHAQAVQQVFAKTPVLGCCRQVGIGGGDEAHVGLAQSHLAEAAVLLFLNEAQQLHLARHGQRVDLVDEQGAVLRFGDQTFARLPRAGIGAPDVAEQLVFEELARHATTIHGNEVVCRAWTALVCVPRVALLAHAGFTGDEDLDVRSGDLRDQVQHALVSRALSDRYALRHSRAFARGRGSRQRALHRRRTLIKAWGFGVRRHGDQGGGKFPAHFSTFRLHACAACGDRDCRDRLNRVPHPEARCALGDVGGRAALCILLSGDVGLNCAPALHGCSFRA